MTTATREDVLHAVTSSIKYKRDKLNEIEELLKLIPAKMIADAFPEGQWDLSGLLDEIVYHLPMSFALIAEVKQYMAETFPQFPLYHENTFVWDDSKSAGTFITYKVGEKYSDKFEFAFRSSQKGATCVLNKVGTKKVDVYEVVCSQAAADEFNVP